MLATSEFRAAAHHALFAEKMLPILEKAEQVIAQAENVARNPSLRMPLRERTALGEKYKAAQRLVPALRAYLYPED